MLEGVNWKLFKLFSICSENFSLPSHPPTHKFALSFSEWLKFARIFAKSDYNPQLMLIFQHYHRARKRQNLILLISNVNSWFPRERDREDEIEDGIKSIRIFQSVIEI